MSNSTGLFEQADESYRPLAERMRPRTLDDLVGQKHLMVRGAPLEVARRTRKVQTIILHGPPGTGKTTIARALAKSVDAEFIAMSATNAGKAELTKVVEQARAARLRGRNTILFLDEVHRWSRTQQDALLPEIESGNLTLIGATTENPGFTVVGALRSRSRIVEVKPLTRDDILELLGRAEAFEHKRLPLTREARASIAEQCDGDARMALGMAEAVWMSEPDHDLSPEELNVVAPVARGRHGRNAEALYDLLSALHKAMRGSDPDAALLYTAMLLEGGEDPLAIIRRVQACASEDVGLADPQAMVQADAAWSAMLRLGPAEGRLPLGQAVIYVATAPKSNAVYHGMNQATAVARANPTLMPPLHMMNAPTDYQRSVGRKAGYLYDHDFERAFSGQQRLPDELRELRLYEPSTQGYEAKTLAPRVAHWRALRGEIQPQAQEDEGCPVDQRMEQKAEDRALLKAVPQVSEGVMINPSKLVQSSSSVIPAINLPPGTDCPAQAMRKEDRAASKKEKAAKSAAPARPKAARSKTAVKETP
ncbi:ATPase AAA [Deinococcus malanensis]|uniref:ATPase AAA n=1 Tax=Deinococcus malanensis TaxID=1706855 RepID=A0ABQ2F1B2_9DEIO|nr:replication-associated recombination protein A [Deinococcus malanensis]GGK40716.1 ATPase AAA [Deinococcus malanensis]